MQNPRCPFCTSSARVIKKGFFYRKNHEQSRSQRYFCYACGRNFSSGTGTVSYRQIRPELYRHLFYLLISGTSQRRSARLLETTQTTVAYKMVRLAGFARQHHQRFLELIAPVSVVQFDDMETFEHTKCKPVSITVAVEEDSRFIIAAEASQMPPKGRLVHIARRRYGYRRDKRKKALRKVLQIVSAFGAERLLLKSDKCPRYPKAVRQWVPRAVHEVHKSRRACVVGQGELKRGGFDPLFSLNHTCAMFRDNLKRLSRRTWCTTKEVDRLQCLLDLYTSYHNEWILAHWGRRGRRDRRLVLANAGSYPKRWNDGFQELLQAAPRQLTAGAAG